MFKRALKLFLGIVSFPICIAVSVSLYDELNQIKALSYNQKYFIFGIVAYLIIHIVFFKSEYLYPVRNFATAFGIYISNGVYILGHEVMHVIATWISKGRVRSFKVSSKGGEITATKSNLFIALAPYFFPFYTIMVAAIFSIASLVIKTKLPYSSFLFLVGFTLSFHLVFTINFLKTKQSDFLHGGYLFSICLVYIVNLIIIGFIFSLLFEEINFVEFLKSAYLKSKDIYAAVFEQLFL